MLYLFYAAVLFHARFSVVSSLWLVIAAIVKCHSQIYAEMVVFLFCFVCIAVSSVNQNSSSRAMGPMVPEYL